MIITMRAVSSTLLPGANMLVHGRHDDNVLNLLRVQLLHYDLCISYYTTSNLTYWPSARLPTCHRGTVCGTTRSRW